MIQQACDLHTELRPDVVAAREVIASGFDLYPPKTQESLRRIDAKLPQLDAIGNAACAFVSPDAGVGILKSAGIDGWGSALKILKHVAPTLVQLKKAGVI